MKITLNEVQAKLLKNLYEASRYGEEGFCYGYNSIDDGLGEFDRKVLVKNMRRLRKLELALYQKGLFTEDGEVAGSGFSITDAGKAYCEEHAEQLGLDLEL
jgi:hypothetical protein